MGTDLEVESTHGAITATRSSCESSSPVDLLIFDDFGFDVMDPNDSRDAYEILTERHRAGSMIVTSTRGPEEWLATFAEPVRTESAIDRFTSNAYDLDHRRRVYRPDPRNPDFT